MKSIEFDVMFWDEDQVQLDNIGIRPNISETDTRPITFYSIDNIKPYYENDIEMCCIISGGEEYIVNQKYKIVKQMLNSF